MNFYCCLAWYNQQLDKCPICKLANMYPTSHEFGYEELLKKTPSARLPNGTKACWVVSESLYEKASYPTS